MRLRMSLQRLPPTRWCIVAALLALAACSPAPAPATQSGAPAAQPAAPAAQSGASAAQPGAPAPGARQPDTLVLSTHAGSGYERYVDLVKQALPDLTIEATTIKASDFAPRVIVEQQNGQFLWDVHMGPVSNI